MNNVFPLKLKGVLFQKYQLHVAATITDIIAAANLCTLCWWCLQMSEFLPKDMILDIKIWQKHSIY